jgi:hypothetical protein
LGVGLFFLGVTFLAVTAKELFFSSSRSETSTTAGIGQFINNNRTLRSCSFNQERGLLGRSARSFNSKLTIIICYRAVACFLDGNGRLSDWSPRNR